MYFNLFNSHVFYFNLSISQWMSKYKETHTHTHAHKHEHGHTYSNTQWNKHIHSTLFFIRFEHPSQWNSIWMVFYKKKYQEGIERGRERIAKILERNIWNYSSKLYFQNTMCLLYTHVYKYLANGSIVSIEFHSHAFINKISSGFECERIRKEMRENIIHTHTHTKICIHLQWPAFLLGLIFYALCTVRFFFHFKKEYERKIQ